jgi:hypothetical protein
MTMNDFESKLANLPLLSPSQGLDDRLRSSKPELAPVEQPDRQRLNQLQPAERKEERMKMSIYARMSPMMKAAATFLVAAILVATGWAAEKIYEKWKPSEVTITLEQFKPKEVVLPDGTTAWEGGMSGTDVSSEDPKAIEMDKRQYEEIKKLIGEKKYKFVKTFENFGSKQYVYSFTHADGTHDSMNFSMPLETVTSWEDYRQKIEKRREEIHKAVLAGKYRLVNCEIAFLTHVCRDVESGEKLEVQRIPLDDGKVDACAHLALPEGTEITPEILAKPQPTQDTTWQEHLDTIRNGKRELLDMTSSTMYIYEVSLPDGSKDIYASGILLKRPEKK